MTSRRRRITIGKCLLLVAITFGFVYAYVLLRTLRERNRVGESVSSSHHIELLGACACDYFKNMGRWPKELRDMSDKRWDADRPDVWGTPYKYELTQDNVTISSAGPDKVFGTADDIATVFTPREEVLSRRIGSTSTNYVSPSKVGVDWVP